MIKFTCCRFFPSKYNREIKSMKMEVERLLMEIIESRKDCVEMGRSNSYGNDLLGILLDEIKKEGGTLRMKGLSIWRRGYVPLKEEKVMSLLTW